MTFAWGSVQKAHFVKGLFGAQLLKNSHKGVAYDNGKKGEIAKGAGNAEQHGYDRKNKVEVGQGVGKNDLLDGFARRIFRTVYLARLDTAFDLLGRKTVKRIIL